MTKLYQKDEVWFAVVWIIAYIVGTSIFDGFDTKLYTLVYHVLFSSCLVFWLYKNSLRKEYGLCLPSIVARRMLFYIPLFVFASCNLWAGFKMQYTITETIYYVLSMLCVGFIEEMLFRGFLFKAISKDNMKMAIIISSITFGIGHIINLFNGSGAMLLPNICQILYAIAFGYLAVILFVKTNSLWPSIITHSFMNASSAFANDIIMYRNDVQIIVSIVLMVIAFSYAEYIRLKNSV